MTITATILYSAEAGENSERTNAMKILVANERLLFRFGHDRVLVMMAQHFHEAGHTITFMARSSNHEILKLYSDEIIDIPPGEPTYLDINEHVASWLEREWDALFAADGPPDLVICGGWPFYLALPVFEAKGVKVLVVDGGAVPLDGFSGAGLEAQLKVRALRRQTLSLASIILPYSSFIARTQSNLDAPNVPCQIFHLGANHMEVGAAWGRTDPTRKVAAIIEGLLAKNIKVILSLGRWEPENYKNTAAVFDYARQLAAERSDFRILLLEEEQAVKAPSDIAHLFVYLGYISDQDLQWVMSKTHLGICFTLWEGFNLPLAEMQWLARPTFVFNVAAHPEVVVEPRFLCETLDEMVAKSLAALSEPEAWLPSAKALARFKEKFTWVNAFAALDAAVQRVVATTDRLHAGNAAALLSDTALIIDVTNSAHDPANSGVVRVTRRFSRALQNYMSPLFVVWDGSINKYVFPTATEFATLGHYHGPRQQAAHPVSPSDRRLHLDDYLDEIVARRKWLLICETASKDVLAHVIPFASIHGMQVASVFHDAIPILYPEFCSESIKKNHSGYMKALSACDVIFPNSQWSRSTLEDFYADVGLDAPPILENLLPGEFGDGGRDLTPLPVGERIDILCVSTIEPRKNHRRLIEAFKWLRARRPDLNCSLTLVGNKYAEAFDLADWVQAQCDVDSSLRWLGIVSDEKLQTLYRDSSFTVYPSIVEGFGMPIVESLWYGRPCLCANSGVMAELAAEGGCVTVDVTDVGAIADGLEQLCTDVGLRQRLSTQAAARQFKSWNDYAERFLAALLHLAKERQFVGLEFAGNSPTPQAGEEEDAPPLVAPDWNSILYYGCLTTNWQMSDSERVGLIGVLSRLKPRCAIEIGTYQGGSLSLISQYVETVFSIDIDPSVATKFSHFENVSFLTGPSKMILPVLLDELDRNGLAPGFILVDGDHSADGVRSDINIILKHKPKAPLVVMMHDSANPGCRMGMLTADWENSPHAHWVDLDFIPGRMIEHHGRGDGELWGGLGLIYMHPAVRQQPLSVGRSANRMLKLLEKS
jgi:glycosyltransferase involved in cell wall biosynthesis